MKAVFLDRDGVINPLVYYPQELILDSPFSARQFRLLPGTAKAINRLNREGVKVIVVSNQPAVAKGKMTLKALRQIDQKMQRLLARGGGFVDEIIYCLHHPREGSRRYRKNCSCRKPKPGSILKAAKKYKIDLKNSFVIGDNLTDIQAGKAVEAKTFLIGRMKCNLCRLMDAQNARPDFIVSNLSEAVSIILKEKGVKNEHFY